MNKTQANLMRKFLTYLTVEKSSSLLTVGNYERDIKSFAEFLLERFGEDFTWKQVGTLDIRAYLTELNKKDYSRRTIARRISALRSFYKYMVRENILESNPFTKVKTPKLEKKLPVFLEEVEINELLELPDTEGLGLRDQAILELLYATGCRVSELVSMRIDDIEDGRLIVHGKGEKDRMVYLNAKAQIALEKYMKERRDTNPYIFPKMVSVVDLKRKNDRCSYRYPENVIEDGHMGKSSVEAMVRRIGKRAGVPGVHPHRFRRTCATFALRRGMPIEQVSKMLGHEQISTTQIYLDMNETELEQAHKKYVI
mgnify:CR=1 FL=1